MGSAPSRRQVLEDPPKKRATRKKVKVENTTNANINTTDEENTNNDKKNIQGSATIQLKRIQELVCDTAKDYADMDKEDVVKLLGKVKRLSALKKENA